MHKVKNLVWRNIMIGHNLPKVPPSLFKGLSKKHPQNEIEHQFKGALIEEYERAIQLGLAPYKALSILMTVAYEECLRLDTPD
jgi:hypothetical protein